MSDFWRLKASPALRTVFAVVAGNLLLFIGTTSLPAFQRIHHHWIFPLLALCFALEWGLAGGVIARAESPWRTPAARATVLFLLGILVLAGVVRHDTILRCFDRCAFKLGAAVLLAGAVFLAQARRRDPLPWNAVRSQVAGVGCLVWGTYLLLHGWGAVSWVLDGGLTAAGLIFWLGRRCRARLTIALLLPVFIWVGHAAGEAAIILTDLFLIGSVFWAAGRWSSPVFPERPAAAGPSTRPPVLLMAFRVALTVGLIVGGIRYLVGPIQLNLNPDLRRRTLLRAEARRTRPSADLSPLARRLRGHVDFLAGRIGERSAERGDNVRRARDYVSGQFKEMGVLATALPYLKPPGPSPHVNVEAVLGRPRRPGEGVWIVGAHGDTAPGTPGADDNASAVAVLLELARLAKAEGWDREVRFVVFGTEEPPFFGTQGMGSHAYARSLKEAGISVKGVLVLEMVGYYSDAPDSQLYPPFLHLLFPDRGDFLSLTSNFSSRRLLKEVKKAWKETSPFPLSTVVLPSVLSSVALSDQLNFWAQGYPALMVSDTAFYRNPHYHRSSDLPETLDYEKMAEATGSLGAVFGRLCGIRRSPSS